MTNKFVFYNDTIHSIKIHPATKVHGCEVDMSPIPPMEKRIFILPEGTYAWVKLWDNHTIFVSPERDE